MTSDEVKAIVAAALPDGEVAVQGGDGKFNVQVVDAGFEGLRKVKRQQRVLAALGNQLSDGSVHAVNVEAFTPAEMSSR